MIHITENLYLAWDEYGYNLKREIIVPELNKLTGKPNKNAGEMRYDVLGYYPNLVSVLKRAVDFIVKQEEHATVYALVNRIESLSNTLTEALKEDVKLYKQNKEEPV